jgi:hypothetical protein
MSTPSGNHTSLEDLRRALGAMGCPAAKCAELAAQLDRRARQLAEARQRPYTEALLHLLTLMRQGWAAQSAANPSHDSTLENHPLPDPR